MKVAVAGYGVEGKANDEYWRHMGHDVTILDERPELTDTPDGVPVVTGPEAFTHAGEFDMVVRSAGVAPHKLAGATKLWSGTNEFFARCPAPIIGVTGSKGKGTTCSLITSILRAAGYTVHLVGNIGVPGLAQLPHIKPSDVVVYELSSFQLWDAERSPHIAVVVHIEPDHLDVHADMAEYLGAKANIARHQTQDDVLIYHPTSHDAAAIAQASPYAATRAVRYGDAAGGVAGIASVYVSPDGQNFMAGTGSTATVLAPVGALKLPGAHNQDNACAAITACLAFAPDIHPQAIAQGLAAFTGLDHRLHYVATVGDVRYYDDSIATTPGSAIAALKAFGQPKLLIVGGSSKGASYQELAQTIAHANVRHIIAIGQTGPAITQALDNEAPHVRYTLLPVEGTTMQAIVAAAHAHAQPGDVVILSPAAASFGMFKNYKDRGEQFVAAVHTLPAAPAAKTTEKVLVNATAQKAPDAPHH